MKDKELIELIKFTAFEMLMPQKISDEDAESILKDYKEAINYSQCCISEAEQLKPLPPNECDVCGALIDYRLKTCTGCGF